MTHPRTAFFIQCSERCRNFHENRRSLGVEAAIEAAKKRQAAAKRKPAAAGAAAQVHKQAVPPTTEQRREAIGEIISDTDGWDWHISENSESLRKIALLYHLDATRLLYMNRVGRRVHFCFVSN